MKPGMETVRVVTVKATGTLQHHPYPREVVVRYSMIVD